MPVVNIPRILIAGVGSGVGKSLITLGLALELKKRGLSVSICITNPNITMAGIYKRVSGRYVRCIDSRLLSAKQIEASIYLASLGSDLVLVEGHRGLYDGFGAGTRAGSDAEIAALTRSPVALVADARGMGNSMFALLRGFYAASQSSGCSIAGPILNRGSTEQSSGFEDLHDREFFEAVMQSGGLSELLGFIPEATFEMPVLPSTPSQQKNLATIARQFFVNLSDLISQHIDIDKFLEAASKAPAFNLEENISPPSSRRCRIAVADDACFSLCFQDNLDLLRFYGAELKSFSPIADRKLPGDITGIYLPGGYLRDYGKDLEANQVLRDQIMEFSQNGGIVYAEGAGCAYLCRQFELEGGERATGVGLLDTLAHGHEDRFSYCDAATFEESVIGDSGILMKGISIGDWSCEPKFPLLKALRVSSGLMRSSTDGFTFNSSFATFGFWHWGSSPEVAKSIVDAAHQLASDRAVASE